MPIFIENPRDFIVNTVNADYYVREISTEIVLHIKIHTAVLYICLYAAYMGACLRTITEHDFRLKMRPP